MMMVEYGWTARVLLPILSVAVVRLQPDTTTRLLILGTTTSPMNTHFEQQISRLVEVIDEAEETTAAAAGTGSKKKSTKYHHIAA